MYCDEFAYMELSIFYNVVAPLYEMNKTVLFIVSTLSGDDNFFTTMLNKALEKLDLGIFSFHVLVAIPVCKRCKEKKNYECKHNKHIVPDWKSEEKREEIKDLLENNLSVYRRESLGIVDFGKSKIFDQDALTYIENKVIQENSYYTKYHKQPKLLYLVIDPNAGGANHTAIVLLGLISGQLIVFGMDSFPSQSFEEQELFFTDFINQISDDEFLSQCQIIYCCERNTGFQSGVLQKLISSKINYYSLRENKKKDYGINTDFYKKNMYAKIGQQYINRRSIIFYDKLICSIEIINKIDKLKTVEERRLDLIKEFIIQLRRCKIVDRNEHSIVNSLCRWSGKTDDSGKRNKNINDDIAVSFLLGCYVLTMFIEQKFETVPYNLFIHCFQ